MRKFQLIVAPKQQGIRHRDNRECQSCEQGLARAVTGIDKLVIRGGIGATDSYAKGSACLVTMLRRAS
jgi:hypothetical protein